MGIIKQDVSDGHLASFPNERILLEMFTTGFDVTWGRRRKASNTELSLYFLKPEKYIAELFGFDYEIALIISSYETIEPRTFQAAEALINDHPAKGRVDQSIYFVLTKDSNAKSFYLDYTNVNPQSRMAVIFTFDDVQTSKSDQWVMRNILIKQLYSNDLFDYQLPLDEDIYFFGREAFISDHINAIKKSQNRGIFGLRKTGKTSIAYKIGRVIRRDEIGEMFYFDCKDPAIRQQKWNELLFDVAESIASHYSIKVEFDNNPKTISRDFKWLISKTPKDKKIVLAFDEIEFISPIALLDPHWKEDFIPFWQTLWSVQSQIKKLATIVIGVNPTVAEIDSIGKIQNPMFGIIQHNYITGLLFDEMKSMVKFFGKRMGINFDYEALEYLHKRYGGHPLLTRLACSIIHKEMLYNGVKRPVTITKQKLINEEDKRDSELVFYCRHVVSELKQFYPDEYAMLELLASDSTVDFMELQQEQEFTRHLKEYGLIEINNLGKPVFAIPVIGRHIAVELARKEGRQLRRKIVDANERNQWMTNRTGTITSELRAFEKIIEKRKLPSLFGNNSFPEAERFNALSVACKHDDFVIFINICNRCFVEGIERYGTSINKVHYFWDDIKQTYPELFHALYRIKIYRHNDLHLELQPNAEKALAEFLTTDLEGHRVSQTVDAWFTLQQCVLDNLLIAIQCEINRIQ